MQKLKDLKGVVLNSQDKNELYLAEVELTEIINSQHTAIKLADTKMEVGEHIGNLNMAQTLVGICKERQSEVGNLANKINYNFRMAAKLMLSKETYDKIYMQANLPRKDVKEAKKELRSNRLE